MATKLEQRKAHKILVKNKAFLHPNLPFDKTSDYVGMLIETNAHRALHGAKPHK